MANTDFRSQWQGKKSNIIFYSDGKSGFRCFQFKVIKHGDDLCRSGILRAQSISSANNEWSFGFVKVEFPDIKI